MKTQTITLTMTVNEDESVYIKECLRNTLEDLEEDYSFTAKITTTYEDVR